MTRGFRGRSQQYRLKVYWLDLKHQMMLLTIVKQVGLICQKLMTPFSMDVGGLYLVQKSVEMSVLNAQLLACFLFANGDAFDNLVSS